MGRSKAVSVGVKSGENLISYTILFNYSFFYFIITQEKKKINIILLISRTTMQICRLNSAKFENVIKKKRFNQENT